MKKKILIGWLAGASLTATAQDLRTRFIEMPDSLLPVMTRVNREDCIDFLESDMAAKVKNRFGEPTEMTALTADYLHLDLTSASTVEMKLLPLNDSTQVTCVVQTVTGPVADSSVRFYDARWQELPQENFFAYPDDDLFFLPVDTMTDELVALHAKADMYLVKAALSVEDTSLTLTYTTPEYLSKEDREALEPLLRKTPLTYEWNGSSFVLKEE